MDRNKRLVFSQTVHPKIIYPTIDCQQKPHLLLLLSYCCFALLLLSACDSLSRSGPLVISGNTMGTTYTVKVVGAKGDIVQSVLQQQVEQLLMDINQRMSTYIDSAEIMQFNRLAVDKWQQVSPELFELVTLSLQFSELSNGYFDITVGPLIELWGFGRNLGSTVPLDEDIDKAKSRVGWQQLHIDQQQQSLKKTADLWLDLSAVAKGYGVDKISELLDTLGAENYLVEIGGEMRVAGRNQHQQPWRLAIEKPSIAARRAQQVINLTDKAIATSGDYRNYFEENGIRFSHTINPLSGRPVRHKIGSVTVIADTAALADAWSTTLNVLGEEKALALAEQENIAAYFILYTDQVDKFTVVYTEGFKPYLQLGAVGN
ncbi:MAG: FAD:protein FMN transferase [Pseudomonadota bacterium]